MKKVLFVLFVTLMMYPVSGFSSSVTKTVGGSASGDYPTIGAALSDINANGLADTVSLMLLDTVYNEHELIYSPTQSQPTALYIFQGGAARPHVKITPQTGLPFGMFINNRADFVLYNVKIEPDTSVPWQAGVNVRSQNHNSRVYIQSGGVIGKSTQRGYQVVADSSAGVYVFGCLIFDVQLIGIYVELHSFPPLASNSPHSLAQASTGGGIVRLNSNSIVNADTGMIVRSLSGVINTSKVQADSNSFNTVRQSFELDDVSADTTSFSNNNAFQPFFDTYRQVMDRIGAILQTTAANTSANKQLLVNNNNFQVGAVTGSIIEVDVTGYNVTCSNNMLHSTTLSPVGIRLTSIQGTNPTYTADGNSISGFDTGTLLGTTGERATITITGGSDTVNTSSIESNGALTNLASFTCGCSATVDKNGIQTPLCTRRNMFSMQKFAAGALRSITNHPAINLTINNEPGLMCAVTISNCDFDWVNNAINVSGTYGGTMTMQGNVIKIEGDGNGLSVDGFGGTGSTLTIDGDSVNNAGVGVYLNNIGTGTNVLMNNLGIDASTNGIKSGSNFSPASVSIGVSGTFSAQGSGKVRVRNNAHLLKEYRSGDLGAAIDLNIASVTCAVEVDNTQIDWLPAGGLHVTGNFNGSFGTKGNVITFNGSTGDPNASSTGIHVSGFGGNGAMLSCSGDSIGNSTYGMMFDSVKAGTAMSLTGFGISADYNGITLNGSPSSLAIGSAGDGTSPLGASRARVRNNAHLLSTSTQSSSVGAAFDLNIGSSSCNLSVSNCDLDWTQTGVNVNGQFGGTFTTTGNVMNLNGGAGTGFNLSGFGGAGSIITCSGDSIGNSTYGMIFDSVKAGTAISLSNLGISADMSGIQFSPGCKPSSLTIGDSAAGSGFQLLGGSVVRIRRNGAFASVTSSTFTNAIDLHIDSDSCNVGLFSCNVDWTGNGMMCDLSNGTLTVKNNNVHATGDYGLARPPRRPGQGFYHGQGLNNIIIGNHLQSSNIGVSVDIPQTNSVSTIIENNSISDCSTGVLLNLDNDSLPPLGMPPPSIDVKNNTITSGKADFVALQYRSKRSELPSNYSLVNISHNTFHAPSNGTGGMIDLGDTLTVNAVTVDSNKSTGGGFMINSFFDVFTELLQRKSNAISPAVSFSGNIDSTGGNSTLGVINGSLDFSNNVIAPSLTSLGTTSLMRPGNKYEVSIRRGQRYSLASKTLVSATPDIAIKQNTFIGNLDVEVRAEDDVPHDTLNVYVAANTFTGGASESSLKLYDTPGDSGSVNFIMSGDKIKRTSVEFYCEKIEFKPVAAWSSALKQTQALLVGGAPNSFNDGSTLYFLGNPTSPIEIHYQNFSGNDTNIVNGTSQPLRAEYNYWGSTDSSTIDNSIVGSASFVPYRTDSVTTTTGTIRGVVYLDQNANGKQDAGEPLLFSGDNWVVIPDCGGSCTVSIPDGFYTFTDLPLGNYTVQLIPHAGYYPTENKNGKTVGFETAYAETVNFGVVFDTTRFRTASYEQWANSEDSDGKLKSNKRKADKVFFKFNLIRPSASNLLSLDFGMPVVGAITRGKLKMDTLVQLSGKKFLSNLNTVAAGETLQVDGIGSVGKKITVKYQWGNAKAVTMKADSLYKVNHVGLPMPNLHNLGEELFPKGFGQSTIAFANGLLVGVPQGKKGANSVLHKTYKDVLSSLVKETKTGRMLHDQTGRCLDSLDGKKKKPMSSQQKSLPPDKQNNALFAELLILKLNITASQTGKFPVGLGELTFDNHADTSNPFNGKTVGMISLYGDTLVSCQSVHGFAPTLSELYSTARMINNAFTEAPLDTFSFAAKTVFTGANSVNTVPYLRPTPGAVPVTIASHEVIETTKPDRYALYQNYPNPFNPSTVISYSLPSSSIVTVKVYNVLGQEIATILDHQTMDAGNQEIRFDASSLSSGVYFYRLSATSIENSHNGEVFTSIKKMMVLK